MSKTVESHVRTSQDLRHELKQWEQAFAAANGGRKPGRDDVKKDAIIAAKYKEYDVLRKRPSKPRTTPRKSTRPSEATVEGRALRERSINATTATPSKRSIQHSIKSLQPPELPALPEEEPTPAHIRCALGPTPQKDGAVLGIFDMLSAGTPSKSDTAATLVLGTPTKTIALPSSDPKPSATPQSASKRFYMDAFAGTPLKRKRDDAEFAPSTNKKLFTTPSFLRRNWALTRIAEDGNERAAAGQPFKKRGLVRSLSTIIQGLKKQEEQKMDDEWDIMNEIEAEEAEADQPEPPRIQVEDSQAVEMPLGPDQGKGESDEESNADPGALDANGQPREVWKKKGLKRQTRRVIMRPVMHKAKSTSALPDREGGVDVVEETQLADGHTKKDRGIHGDDDDDGYSDDEARHDSQQSPNLKAKKAAPRPKKKEADPFDVTNEKSRKVKPQAHANYRALKIKNKNSKAKGKGGRFGRR